MSHRVRVEMEGDLLIEGYATHVSYHTEADGRGRVMVEFIADRMMPDWKKHAAEALSADASVKTLEPGWLEPPDTKPKSKNPLAGAFA